MEGWTVGVTAIIGKNRLSLQKTSNRAEWSECSERGSRAGVLYPVVSIVNAG